MSSSTSDPAAETSPSTEATSSLESDRADALDELAAAASQRAVEMPTLLLVVNKTSELVLLTSADGKNTATIDPGGSLRLASERVCDWMPLTASVPDGRVIAEYAQPCRGQTWTITDQ